MSKNKVNRNVGGYTVKEHQQFMTKMEISLISDKRLYNGSLQRFQILNGAASTGDLINLILAIKIVYLCCDLSGMAIFQVFNLEIGYK